ncbi:Transcription factor GTE4 [Euphorbia peplus]|nr:Transcription factor GTE4 [Euphorbia peplus]
MATGPREKQKRLLDNSTSKNLYSRKVLNKSHISRDTPQFSTGENNCPLPSPTVASDDSSNSLPGYVHFDNKVRISLNSGSKYVIRQLKRKLVGELDRVRSLKIKLEAVDFHSTGVMTSCSNNNRVGTQTLARVNSEVSYVGTPEPKSLQGLALSVDGSAGEKVDRMKKAPKINKNPESGIGKEKVLNSDNVSDSKKLKAGSGGKKATEGKVMEKKSEVDRKSREMMKQCGVLLDKLMKHQYGWVFNKPVDVKRLNLRDYHKIIKHPMDLGTVSNRLKKNWYKSPKGFAEDVRLTFNNAKTYNEKGQDVHIMADVLLKLFEEKWAALKAEYDHDERFQMGSKPLTSKRKLAPHAPSSVPPPLKKPSSETRISDQAEVMTKAKPVGSDIKGSTIVTNEGKAQLSEKPKENEPERREMSFKEKQILSTNLLSLPSEKLDTVVQIIKKRNPGLCQEDDEIEVDIDSFDSETLWELDRLVNDHMKGKDVRQREPVLQTREEAGHILQETNLTSFADRALEASDAAEKIVRRSPVIREEQDNRSRSCSSGSSSGVPGSSSSGSDSSSSGYCSDTGR